jgi:hypothetical protein
VPAEGAGEQAAEQHADAAAAGAHEAVDAHRLRPLGRLGEQIHDQRQRDRRHHRAAEPLHCARGDQPGLALRQPARQRRQREQRDAEQEQLAVPVQIAEPSAEQQKAAEREHVGVDHPDQRGLGELQIRSDRRQRDVHDRGVEHDHQHAQAQHHQGEPAFAVVGVAREGGGHGRIFVGLLLRRVRRAEIDEGLLQCLRHATSAIGGHEPVGGGSFCGSRARGRCRPPAAWAFASLQWR